MDKYKAKNLVTSYANYKFYNAVVIFLVSINDQLISQLGITTVIIFRDYNLAINTFR